MMSHQGYLRKMSHCLGDDNKVDYYFRLTEPGKDESENILLNQYIGSKIKLEFNEDIACVACGRKIKKTFNNGYCFPCVQNLAECDLCIMKPELCHYDEGTCRDDAFGDKHCNILHTLYISQTSGVKVGITRQYNEQSRWVDQGAVKALRLGTVTRRKYAGFIEAFLAKEMPDKTNWRKMLKNDIDESVDLYEVKKQCLGRIDDLINGEIDIEQYEFIDCDNETLLENFDEDNEAKIQEIEYPVEEYPEKVKSFNFDKNPVVEGVLKGIKAQYLIFDEGVINMRKFAGYKVSLEA